MKCLILFEPKPKLKEHLSQKLDGVDVVFADGNEQTILEHAGTTDICVSWRPSQDFLKGASHLKLFVNPGAGMRKLLAWIHEADRTGDFTIVNGHGNAFFTAEHAVAMLLTVVNGIVPHHQWMLEGKWRWGDEKLKSTSLKGKTIGLIGYGHVNRTVEKLLTPFGVQFLYYSHSRREQTIHEIAAASDILMVALPHTSDTENLIDDTVLKQLGPEGVLINVARGEIVNEEALYHALKNNMISAAGIDVWYNYEPIEVDGMKRPYSFPFHELGNVLLSPHRAASPFDDLGRWDDVIENINRFAQGRTDLINVVDASKGY